MNYISTNNHHLHHSSYNSYPLAISQSQLKLNPSSNLNLNSKDQFLPQYSPQYSYSPNLQYQIVSAPVSQESNYITNYISNYNNSLSKISPVNKMSISHISSNSGSNSPNLSPPNVSTLTNNSSNTTSNGIDRKKPLSTSSPIGIAAASMVTPTRIANLLIKNGPLPIRHITSQLSYQIPGFNKLSLSKQRRLIMGVFENIDYVNGVSFEKIGWGQWGVRYLDQSVKNINNVNAVSSSNSNLNLNTNYNITKKNKRSQSITNPQSNPHNLSLPTEPTFPSNSSPITASAAVKSNSNAIESSSSDSEDEGSYSSLDSDEELFPFDNEQEIMFAGRVPVPNNNLVINNTPNNNGYDSATSLSTSPNPIFSPPNNTISISIASSLTSNSNSRRKSYSISKPGKPIPRSRINSIDNLDYSNNNTNSINNNSNAATSSTYGSFGASVGNAGGFGSRRGSIKQSSLRSTLNYFPNSNSGSTGTNANANANTSTSSNQKSNNSSINNRLSIESLTNHEDTDVEDWESMGPENLRKKLAVKNENINSNLNSNENERGNDIKTVDEIKNRERQAAFALVELRSI